MPKPAQRPVVTDDVRAAFLGVERSLRGQRWAERLSRSAAGTATMIAQRHDVPELIARILAARGAGVDAVPDMLDPRLRAFMPDPSTLQDMDRAASRLADAIESGEKITVFGDYDVDGGSSAALMRRFARHHGRDVAIYIPDRMTEGYGPNSQAIGQIAGDGTSLIVTVDCGTTSDVALAAADGLADVVVIYHHQANETLPPVHAVVNPNRQDDLSGLGHLCAAGVVFLVLAATTRELRRRDTYKNGMAEPALLEMLDIVALATVCDVVPLHGLNRAFVAQGLQIMRLRNNIGLRALADTAGLNAPPTTYHLGYLLGPRINAGGRIGDCGLGAQLLSEIDPAEAERIAGVLDRLNRERKAMETEILDAAIAEAGSEPGDIKRAILDAVEAHAGTRPRDDD
ncbi:MAG: DHH family phosphoesterase, partial [Planctomycetota bacterium]